MKRFLCTSSLLLAAVLVLTFTAQVFAASTGLKASAQLGTRHGDGAGGDVVLRDLPDMSAADRAVTRQIPVHHTPGMSEAQYQWAKSAASHISGSTRPQDGAKFKVPPASPNTNVARETPGAFSNFFGQAEGCATGNGWVPSDMGLAVSSSFIVQTVNECIQVFNKAGAALTASKDLCGIFGLPVFAGHIGCFDPRVLYDAQANKFLVIASYYDLANNGWILTASASNPTLAWHHHAIFFGAALADYPTLGQTAFLNNPNNSVITICTNLFFNAGGFTDECIFPKKSAVYGTLGGFNAFSGFALCGSSGCITQNSMQPVDSYELSGNPRAQFTVNTLNDNGGTGLCGAAGAGESGLLLWAFSGMTSAQPHASGWFTGCGSTSVYSFPGSADNAGFCFACIETIDNRITAKTFYSQGKIIPSIDTWNGATSAVLGWDVEPFLDVNGGGCTGGVLCPNISAVTIEKEWCYDCGGGNAVEAYFGAQAPDPENDWTMYATFSSRSDFFNISPGMFYDTTRVTNVGTFIDSGTFSCVLNNPYGTTGSTARWGDYAAAAPDDPGTNPKNVAATWGSGMYVNGSGTWGTCITGVHPQDGP
jgi:hypothetical protein